MKYNWPAVVTEFRKIMSSQVKLYSQRDDKNISEDFMEYFNTQLFETDTFHPFDTDGELSRAMDRMPARCDYRSIKSYWAFKDGKENIADALYSMMFEVSDLVEDHFSNVWNFAPGVKLPERIVMPKDWSDIADKSVARILKAARS
jgi:hypothetical protein